MDTRARLFRENRTVAEVLERLRQDRRPGRSGFFVVDSDNHLTGWVDMQDLALAEHDELVGDLVQDVRAVVNPMATREEVGEKMEEHRLSDLAVLDLDGRLIGVIRHASMVEAEKERAIQTMVGVSVAVRICPGFRSTSSPRSSPRRWSDSSSTPSPSSPRLRPSLPVVAGQSGNTGAQALAVTMRGLALREIRVAQWPRVVFKETNVGFWNGVVVALTTSVACWCGAAPGASP